MAMGTRNLIRKNFMTLTLALCCTSAFAQEKLSLEQAIIQGLEKNYDLQISLNLKEIAANSVNYGNARLTPRISANAGGNYNINNSQIDFANGTEQNVDGAKTQALNGSLQLNYTIFSGMANLNFYRKLQTNERISDVQFRFNAEATISQIYIQYYAIARLTHQVEIAEQLLDVSRDRLQRARGAFNLGSSSNLEALNAEVNYNQDSITVILARQELENAKRNLNLLLGTDISRSFSVDTAVIYAPRLLLDNLLAEAMRSNASLVLALYQEQVAQFDYRIAKGERYPTIDLNSSYLWTRSQNDAGFLLSQEQRGINNGITMRWTLFDGNRINANIENANLAIENSHVTREKAKALAERDIRNAFLVYETAFIILEIQRSSLTTNEQNFARTAERLQLGQITTTQFREAQINLARAQVGFYNALYDAKIAEIELIRLSGLLMN